MKARLRFLLVLLFAFSGLAFINLEAKAQKKPSFELFSLDEAAPDMPIAEKTELYVPSEGFRPYSIFADKAVNALIQKKEEAFYRIISPNLINHFTEKKIQKNITESLLPFFEGFRAFNEDMDIAPATDAWDAQGYSFYQSFQTHSGDTKHFLVQVVVEDGKMVIANLTPDAQTPYDEQKQ